MKKLFASAICLLVITGLSGFRKIADWVQYNSTQGNYKILMPALPKEEIQKVPSALGELTMYIAMFESEDNDDNMIYMSAFSEYPTEKINSDIAKEGLDRFFKGAAEGAAKNMNGKVKTISISNYKEYPAREVVLDLNMGGQEFLALQKLILVKNRFFMLQTFTKPGRADNSNAKKFFESFELNQ